MCRFRKMRNRINDQPAVYEIRLRGHIDKSWSSWLGDMAITYEDDDTVLTGKMTDQSALRGLLSKIWDMNQTLISINRVEMAVPPAS